jgi:hypothetical protein
MMMRSPIIGRNSPSKSKSGRMRRAEKGERISVIMPGDVATMVRVRCAKERRSVSDAMTELARTWLRSRVSP